MPPGEGDSPPAALRREKRKKFLKCMENLARVRYTTDTLVARGRKTASIRTCIHNRKCRMAEGFFCWPRQIFAGILCVLQENLTQAGGKRPGQAVLEAVNTGSKIQDIFPHNSHSLQ